METAYNLPESVGVNAPALVQEYLADNYGVKYSYPSCRRLLKEAGLKYQKPRRTAVKAEGICQKEFHDEPKKQTEIDAVLLKIDPYFPLLW